MLRAHPAVAEALARRGDHRPDPGAGRHVGVRRGARARALPGRRIGWCDMWYRASERGNPYAHHVTGLHPVVDLNTMELLEIEDSYQRRRRPRGDGRVPARPAADAAARGRAAGDQPARRGRLHPRRQPAELAELAAAARLQPPRGPGPAPGRVPATADRLRSVAHRLSFAEMVVPYRDASPDHYRRTAFDIGEWGLGFMTTSLSPRLRLPGRDHLPGRGGARLARRAGHHPERDLHPRGGQRRAVEARRRAGRGRGPAGAAAGDLLPRDRGQLRVPGVLAVLPGRRISSARSGRPGSWSPRTSPRRAAARPTGRVVDHGIYAPFHQHFIVARLDLDVDGAGQHGLRQRLPAGLAGRRTTRTRSG